MKFRWLVLFLMLTNCAAITAEKTKSDGLLGSTENKYLFQVDSNYGFLYRVTYIMAVLAEIGDQNIRNQGNAALAIAQINGISQTITSLFTLAVFPCGAPGSVAASYPTAYPSEIYAEVIPPESPPAAGSGLFELKPGFDGLSYDQDEGGECPAGIYRTRYEVSVSQLDQQILSLAYAALPESDFKNLVNDAEEGKTISVVSDVITSFWKLAIDAHYAFAVSRQNHQLWSYIINDDGTGKMKKTFTTGTFNEALSNFDYTAIDSQNVNNPWIYRTAMYSLFQDIQQSCYNIQKQLPVNNTTLAANRCPRQFLPRMDSAGYLLIQKNTSSIDDKKNPITLYNVANQCVPLDNVSFDFTDDSIIETYDYYYCDSSGNAASITTTPPVSPPN